MTRMEKWESYRSEISQSSKVGHLISNDNQKIDKYKKEIDRINPTILQNLDSTNPSLHKGVSEVIVSQNKFPEEITKLFVNLNKAKEGKNKNTISTILFNLNNYNILDENKHIKEKWLHENADYADLDHYISDLNLNRDSDFEKDLHSKYENLSVKNEGKIGNIETLSRDMQKNVGHHVFVISISIASVFFIITLILLLVRFCI